MVRNHFCKLVICSLLAVSSISTQAATITQLTISDGATTILAVDNGVGDTNSIAGVLELSASVGSFDVNVATGFSTPALGTPSLPVLDLSSVNFTSTTGGTLTVMLTTTGLTGPLPSADPLLEAGGTTDGSVHIESYIDPDNTAFGTPTSTGIVSSTGSGSFSGTDNGGLVGLGLSVPYSATIVATVVHTNAGDISNIGAVYSIVPEPSTAILFVSSFAIIMRRKSAEKV